MQRRTLIAGLATAAALAAQPAHGQGQDPPPGQQSIIAVQVGATSTDNLCLIATRLVTLALPMPGDPPPSPYDPVPPSASCKGTPPIVLRRARTMTVTLLGRGPAMQASWFARGQSRPLTIRPYGEPPTATWFLRLPATSGRLILRVFFPPSTTFGGVTQSVSDYKVSIRRRAPAYSPPPPTTFTDSGR